MQNCQLFIVHDMKNALINTRQLTEWHVNIFRARKRLAHPVHLRCLVNSITYHRKFRSSAVVAHH